MKIRFAPSLLLAIVLFLTSTVPVDARPNQEDPQDALIRQVLIATAVELGWSTSVDYAVPPTGIPVWHISKHRANFQLDGAISIRAYSSANAAANTFQDEVGGGAGQHFVFHGCSAFSITVSGLTAIMFQSDRFLIEAVGDQATARLEATYRNAVAYDLIAGDSGEITPTIPETVTPELTVTPEPGAAITVRAYAENYDPATDVIDNSINFGSVSIRGRVTDLNTGAAIEGATVQVASGASSASTRSAADGSYSLTAVVPGGQDSGEIGGIDFALPAIADLTIEVIPALTELVADGAATSEITIQVRDLQGNPVKDRAFSLEASADVGPGTLQPAQATTDDTGVIQATYTAFKLEPGLESTSTRHEVTISARDNATGLTGSGSIFVNQYQLTVLYGEYIPACTRCTFPSEFTVSVTDYWNNPIPNAPLTLRIEGGSSDGTLVLDASSGSSQQEITLATDNNGRATVYYKWQGSVDIAEAVQRVVVLDGTTHAQETKAITVHGLDIAMARVEEAGFTGVTGQQAFLKIYFKERAHPDLQLDRFNADSPNKLGLRVTIGQYHSDGADTSVTFESTGGWEEDAGGLFVKMYNTPHMPYVIPVNDGSSWYDVRVDAVVDRDVLLPDLVRQNNDTIIVLRTGSPDGWLHTWLKDGILTPHSWAGVVFKCVGRFLPVVGDAMTAIDSLNQAYNLDVLGLGQSTAQVLTDALEKKSALLPVPGVLDKIGQTKASAVNNVVSCLQDTYAVYKEKNPQGSSRLGGLCAMLATAQYELDPSIAMDEADAEMLSAVQDRFVQGMLLDSPELRGVVVYGLGAGNVTLRDSSGRVFEDQERMSDQGNVAVYVLPVAEQFTLEVATDRAFDIGIYEAGGDDASRRTIRHEVQAGPNLAASMAIGGTSDYGLELDNDGDGAVDETLNAQATTLDVAKPQITDRHPEQGATVSAEDASILARYADNPGGTGIDVQALRIFVDGVDLTSNADVQADYLYLSSSDIGAGEHTIRLVVSDRDGNAAVAEWTFTAAQQGFSLAPNTTILLVAGVVGGGVLLILLVGAVFAISYLRRRRQPVLPRARQRSQTAGRGGAVQDRQGNWWTQDPNSGRWLLWNGQSWQASQMRPSAPPPPTRRPFAATQPKGQGCLPSIAVVVIMSALVIGGATLVAFQFFPNVTLPRAATVSVGELLKVGGGGVLLTLLGTLLLRGGFKSIATRRVIVEDEVGRRREKRGCAAILNGLGQVSFGFLLLTAGLGMAALALYQQLLPLLGY